jgi:hypothetical protein
MNLARHLAVLWRYRRVVALGVILGIALAIMAAYKVPSMERRGMELWSSQSDIFVTQPGFPWGRVTLPPTAELPAAGEPLPTAPTEGGTGANGESLEFADPNRFTNLAHLYSVIALSDEVRARLPERPGPGQLEARAYDVSGNGTAYLPIVRLTTNSTTAEGAVTLNQHAIEGLKEMLSSEQRKADIPANQRVRLSELNAPSAPMLIQGRSTTASILAFMLCVLGAVALAHVLESLRKSRESAARPAVVDEIDGEFQHPSPSLTAIR